MSNTVGIKNKILKLQSSQIVRNGTHKKDKKDRGDQFSSSDDQENQQINELVQKLPKLNSIFEVHRKIGEGTFSSVYLGSLRQHANLPDGQKRLFAIKHLVPTAHPARVEHELKCLQDIGGRHNVIGVELCLRQLDTIVFIMPYIPHRKFAEYMDDMDRDEVSRYLHALLIALRHVHSFGVIHRDVKPSNFLYDRERRRYLLVDFGLAQPVVTIEPPPAHSNGTAKRLREEDCDSSPGAKRVALDLSLRGRHVSVPRRGDTIKQTPLKHVTKVSGLNVSCACAGLGGVCTGCGRRPTARAPRAGTQGFRPPEVLLKSPLQGTAVDVWAAGVVLASLLTSRYPFFRAADDVSALAELVDLLGSDAVHRVAAFLRRRVVMSGSRTGICLRKLAQRLRNPTPPPCLFPECLRCRLPAPQCLCLTADTQERNMETIVVDDLPEAAFNLAARLLDPDPRTRITAEQALKHPFLAHLPH
ncbi:cell division cycle 7-related protein kinase [Pieris rapae]|uniref:cell division cycle 7-related protein kinase n=1 Tax=Pieris rapae TaxID=64459 RepID=UPI000B92A1EC|nr:cell division cycle 7-related protein kinase [Pieris rapae]